MNAILQFALRQYRYIPAETALLCVIAISSLQTQNAPDFRLGECVRVLLEAGSDMEATDTVRRVTCLANRRLENDSKCFLYGMDLRTFSQAFVWCVDRVLMDF